MQQRLLDVIGLTDPLVQEEDFRPADVRAHVREQKARVEERLLEHPLEYWRPRLAEAKVPASPVNHKVQLLEDPQVLANEYLSHFTHPVVGDVTVVSPPVKLSKTALKVREPSPTLGQHTVEVLSRAGLTEQVIRALIKTGKIVAPEPPN